MTILCMFELFWSIQCCVSRKLLYCRVARINSLYHKLLKNPSSVSAISVISISINVQLLIQISIQISYQISNPTKTYSNSLQINIQHTSVCSLQFIVMSYYRMLRHFPTFHIVFDYSHSLMRRPIDLKPSLRESPLQPEFNEGSLGSYQLCRKSRLPVFSAICWILSTGNLLHLKALLILVNLGSLPICQVSSNFIFTSGFSVLLNCTHF